MYKTAEIISHQSSHIEVRNVPCLFSRHLQPSTLASWHCYCQTLIFHNESYFKQSSLGSDVATVLEDFTSVWRKRSGSVTDHSKMQDNHQWHHRRGSITTHRPRHYPFQSTVGCPTRHSSQWWASNQRRKCKGVLYSPNSISVKYTWLWLEVVQ